MSSDTDQGERFVLAQQHNAQLVSSDHHEFDPIDGDGKVQFWWIR